MLCYTNDVKNELEILSKEIKNGNEEALIRLYEQQSRNVFLFAYSILKNSASAEDVLQNTFIKIKNNIHQYNSNTNFLNWILTIAKNFSLNVLKQRNKLSSINEFEFEDNTQIEKNFEDKTVINAVLKLLDPIDRQIVILSAIEGYKMREIASLLQIPLGTALWRFNKSIKKLKIELEKIEKEGV